MKQRLVGILSSFDTWNQTTTFLQSCILRHISSLGLCREDSAQFSKQLFHAVPPTRRSLGFSLPRHTSFYSVSSVAVAVYGLEAWLVTLEMLDAMSWYANAWKDYQNILVTPWNQGVYVGLRSWNSSPDLIVKVCVFVPGSISQGKYPHCSFFRVKV